MQINQRMFNSLTEQGKKAADLARHLNVGTNQTSAWKAQKSDPPSKYITQIAEFLGVSTHWLLTGEENCSYVPLPEEEKLLVFFRQLDDTYKSIATGQVAGYVKEMQKEKEAVPPL